MAQKPCSLGKDQAAFANYALLGLVMSRLYLARKQLLLKAGSVYLLVFSLALLQSVPAHAEFSTLAVFSSPTEKAENTRVEVGQWYLPDKPAKGFYRVKMIRSEICNTDRRVLAGTKQAEVTQRKVVMGHEGIGRIYQTPERTTGTDLQIGDLVVVAPHYVDNNDESLKKGLPNLSPKMKHTGIHINGVFADYMDFPEYTIMKIPGSEELLKQVANPQTYYDEMVMIEPLACVQRGYTLLQKQDYFQPAQIKEVLILGSGPMGLIHALHIQDQYPSYQVDIFDIDPLRRNLAKNVPFLRAHVLEQLDYSKQYDLVVTATSSESASVHDAVSLVRNNGVILLFSGIDLKEGQAHPKVASVDIEDVHRYEGSVRLINQDFDNKRKSIYFLGTSGYVHDDFCSSIKELHKDLLLGDKAIFRGISTTTVLGLANKVATDLSLHFHDAKFSTPALVQLLKVYNPEMKGDYNVHNYLKIFVRHE